MERFISKINIIDEELAVINAEIRKLQDRKHELTELKEKLKEEKDLKDSKALGERNWENESYEWSKNLKSTLNNVFGIENFRPQQLSAMNATLSKKHALIVMPTGAGKSLCYQLPALVDEGITVVVSPLISLMEDQVMSLTKRSVPAKLMTSTSSREETTAALNDLTDGNSNVKLLYATPERFAKSKRFMAKLQKCHAEGRLQRIAIDEVHCCSQWGHDFRPDYKFLGILSSMFPGVPILGLTATATTRVLIDVQKMLNIRGCLLIKSSFNRPNLYYQIISKPSSSEECIDILEKMLGNRYRNQSGIIYATSIKDCEDLAQGLRKRGLKVGCYHASLEASVRSSIHSKWTQKYYQAIVATVAFGLGIDKPDVRFVIHHSLSKAMESYYQESGRAGRDGERAECIMMFRTQDIFKVSTMVFSSAGSLDHLYGMVKYCLEPFECRRKIIATHFDEQWGSDECAKMCDRCLHHGSPHKELQIQSHCKDLYKIIKQATRNDTKLTAQKLVDSWMGKGPTNLRVSSVKVPQFLRVQAEMIVAFLLIEHYLKEDFHFTAYSTISYIKIGPNGDVLEDEDFKLKMTLKNFNELDCDTEAPKAFVKSDQKNHTSKNDHKLSKNKKNRASDEDNKRKRIKMSDNEVITIE